MSTRGPVTKALIPAAGRGTRFLPITKVVPKELAPLVTTPALEFVVAEAAGVGITDVVLVVSPGKAAISAYFESDPELEDVLRAKGKTADLERVLAPTRLADLSYVEQLTPRGLGDAIAHGESFADGGPLAVLLPDDLIDERDELLRPMLEVYARHGGIVLGLIDVGPVEISKYGCAVPAPDADADVVALVDLVEKPAADEAPSTLAIIGRYILPPEIFDALRRTGAGALGEIQITDAMKLLCAQGVPTHGVVFGGRRYDTGDPLEYMKAAVQLAARHPVIGTDFRAWLREYDRDAD